MIKCKTKGIEQKWVTWGNKTQCLLETKIDLDLLDPEMLLASTNANAIEIIFKKKHPPELNPKKLRKNDVFIFNSKNHFRKGEAKDKRFLFMEFKESYNEQLPGNTLRFEAIEDRKVTPAILKALRGVKK